MSTNLSDITLQTVDFNWIEKTTKLSHLKRAIALIEQDGNYYTELKDACYVRMEEIDPSCKRITANSTVAQEMKADILQELESWQSQVGRKDVKKAVAQPQANLEDYEQYFDNEQNKLDEKKKKQRAQKERMKGNEAIKSKDFDEAISYYSKSIELDSTMHQSYANRALAYLKKKQLQKCLDDCQKALQIDSKYTKAWHRKAKALVGLKRRVEGYKCFKQILKLQPQNVEVNKEMMQLREQMNEDEIRQLQSHLIPKSQFKKITIEEESDQQIQEK